MKANGLRGAIAIIGLCVALVLPTSAPAAKPVPATGTLAFALVHDQTIETVGANTVVRFGQQVGVTGTLGASTEFPTIVIASHTRIQHPSGAITWMFTLTGPFFIDAEGCPSFAQLSLHFIGHVRPGEETVEGHFDGGSESGDIHVAGEWERTSGLATYSGWIECATAP